MMIIHGDTYEPTSRRGWDSAELQHMQGKGCTNWSLFQIFKRHPEICQVMVEFSSLKGL